MKKAEKQNAVVYCEGAFNTPNGKTAHGLVRFTRRYRVLSVIDSNYAGQDAGTVLDGRDNRIPVVGSLGAALDQAEKSGLCASHFVVGLAPDGGRLSPAAYRDVRGALEAGLNVDCGLHDFLSEDPALAALAVEKKVKIRDIRKPPLRSELHFFDGRIEQVTCTKIAILGTDSAIGKRTSAWILQQGLEKHGLKTEMIGTGQTAWMQGARYGIVLDSLVNDFVAGEIEYAVWSAWNETRPDVILIEGQGSLMNPAYPGGFEILAAGRPDFILLQHAPMRREYDGFPGYLLHPLPLQIQALEMLSGKKVAAITINHEDMRTDQIATFCDAIERSIGLPAVDILNEGPDRLIQSLKPLLEKRHDT